MISEVVPAQWGQVRVALSCMVTSRRELSRVPCVLSLISCVPITSSANVVGGRGLACGQAGGLNAWGLAGAALACHAHGTDAGEAGARRGRGGGALATRRPERAASGR